jgi:hypothetical protein
VTSYMWCTECMSSTAMILNSWDLELHLSLPPSQKTKHIVPLQQMPNLSFFHKVYFLIYVHFNIILLINRHSYFQSLTSHWVNQVLSLWQVIIFKRHFHSVIKRLCHNFYTRITV